MRSWARPAQRGRAGGGRPPLRRIDANAVVAANFAIGRCCSFASANWLLPTWTGRGDRASSRRQARRSLGNRLQTAAASPPPGSGPVRGPFRPIRPPSRCSKERGGVSAGGVHIHSVRLPGLIAHKRYLRAQGQSLTIRHDSYDRRSFMPGSFWRAGRVERPGLTRASKSSLIYEVGPASDVGPAVTDVRSGSCSPPTTAWPLGIGQDDRGRRSPGSRRVPGTVYRYFPGGATSSWARWWVGVRPLLPSPLRRGARGDTLEEVMERAWSSRTTRSSSTRCSSASCRPSPKSCCPG